MTFDTVAPTATPVRAAKVLTIVPTSKVQTRELTKAPTKVSVERLTKNPTDLESELMLREVVGESATNSSDRSNDVPHLGITVLAIAVGIAVICFFLVRKSGPHQHQTTAPNDSRKMREDRSSSLSSPKNPPLNASNGLSGSRAVGGDAPLGRGGGVAQPSVEDLVTEESVEPRRQVEDGVDGQVGVAGGRVGVGGAGHHQQ